MPLSRDSADGSLSDVKIFTFPAFLCGHVLGDGHRGEAGDFIRCRTSARSRLGSGRTPDWDNGFQRLELTAAHTNALEYLAIAQDPRPGL